MKNNGIHVQAVSIARDGSASVVLRVDLAQFIRSGGADRRIREVAPDADLTAAREALVAAL